VIALHRVMVWACAIALVWDLWELAGDFRPLRVIPTAVAGFAMVMNLWLLKVHVHARAHRVGAFRP